MCALEKKQIAETFNNNFTAIAYFVGKIPDSTGEFGETFLIRLGVRISLGRLVFSFSLLPELKVLKNINGLSPNPTIALGGLRSWFIKDGASMGHIFLLLLALETHN